MRSSRRRFSKSARLLASTLLIAAATATAQTVTPAARDIVRNNKPLSSAEIAVVLAAVREAMTGMIYRLSYTVSGPGPLVLMGSDGRPRLIRGESGTRGYVDLVSVTEYTREPAKRCDGTDLGDELVVEYEHKSPDDRWTARARARTASEVLAPIFDMLTGVIPLDSGSLARVGDHTARALVGAWRLPPGAIPASPLQARMQQSLWIDTTSLLPVRWSMIVPLAPELGVPPSVDYGLWFTYDTASELRRPDGVAAPTCVR
jgi:hypothetical protein